MPVICFPKGIGEKYKEFLGIVRPNGINIDYDIDPKWAKENLKDVCLQGGMDPKILFEDEKKINFEVDKYLNNFRDMPYIFNLGHGLLPETNPDPLTIQFPELPAGANQVLIVAYEKWRSRINKVIAIKG